MLRVLLQASALEACLEVQFYSRSPARDGRNLIICPVLKRAFQPKARPMREVLPSHRPLTVLTRLHTHGQNSVDVEGLITGDLYSIRWEDFLKSQGTSDSCFLT